MSLADDTVHPRLQCPRVSVTPEGTLQLTGPGRLYLDGQPYTDQPVELGDWHTVAVR